MAWVLFIDRDWRDNTSSLDVAFAIFDSWKIRLSVFSDKVLTLNWMEIKFLGLERQFFDKKVLKDALGSDDFL